MKFCGRIFFRPVWLLIAAQFWGGHCRAELLGSPYPDIQKHFNQLLTTNACPSCDLRGAVMNHLNLAKADLQGANLTGAQLNFTCLTSANLRDADLHGAWLIGADLAGADLNGTILEGDAVKTWPGKGANRIDKKQAATDIPDLFADWQTAAAEMARRSVDEVPVIEVVPPVPSTAEEIRFWQYLLGLRQAAEQPSSSASVSAEQSRTGQASAKHK
ncbi:hypothetical protein GCAAIG_13415 [Candidatus Electronema halotolerans]